ncbi:N-acetylglucosamine repressor [Hartmannibacter diazotrophicus]|uniref:N-acetylglucosamine repressor n=1 Tax=Hartmannibacter diazotrophicus TaxID=1482074 RepID=A0A2C9D5W1_9HYPH|nr:ROK family transcriptional regulator [Hartmannibacter diazotrophicus]SON55121.1 N-acetylglucosamine repressor [Hartmannibacter diazotrophicus]
MKPAGDLPGGGRFRPTDPGRGTNQSGVRLYNERLILSLVRRHRAVAKVELARLTGLSAQTVSVIANQLQKDGLLRREEPQRGRVGQPSVPFSLNPDGAYAYGLKIGRRSSDLVLIDFLGKVRKHLHITYAYPLPDMLTDFAQNGIREIEATLKPDERDRIVGLGLASPNELWNWAYEVGGPPGALDVWRDLDLRQVFASHVNQPVYLCNDATAACAAELVFGNSADFHDFLYIFVGSFVGGGLVVNGALLPGRYGNAASLGSMPVPGPDGSVQQLIRCASLYTLEARLIQEGKKAGWLWASPDAWEEAGQELDDWIGEAARSLAYAITAASAVVDFQAAVIDGAFPTRVRDRLVTAIKQEIETFNRQGLSPIDVVNGEIGASAREVGAGCLPLLAKFTLDREVLFKETV